MPAPRPASDRHIVLRLPRHTLKIAGIAFAAGLLLFLLVWATGRKDDFYKPSPAQPTASAQTEDTIAPLPAPLPAQDGASDMPQAKPPADTPTPVDTAPAAPPAPTPLPEDAAPGAPGSAALSKAPVAGGDRPVPIQGQMPPPRYPSAALRRGDAGDVVVRVDVDAAGNPGGVTLVQRSGSRDLDRAAMEAVRHWRFHPAQRNGQPVAGSTDIPFEFKPAQ
ncbi:energy transducer TonB [Xanthomonas vasicola]|uniref:energy transducer TonB n=3 Tax=Xanthomonas vasicola TaxID=56459 RepID=UPI0003004A22|nr:energy transducer TonB [Xanthomonas vasicola]KFA39893.1 energy transducer TonB [Xanthomonas vasicola pv. musacearum NCPPB 4384]KFA13493.1 energy transducer TonB [Xanthomonas vasicola pv. musacearum NCPPB 2005]KFA16557.1 energy transducer TonB [Xanthomonas vasicola pv. musacearum NCPPB 4392]MBV6744194.1 TonB family protein [Xanthomonas vasicola pv. musacearum NCPPB 2251]MBV7280557.1 TonB family protein [Xanthomonas vasicola pv. musacearum]